MAPRPEDLRAGLIFIAIASVFATVALRTLEIGTASMMGPGFFPLMVSAALAAMGVAVIATSRRDGSEVRRRPVSWRGVVWVLAAPVAFGLLVRTLGLLPALLAANTCAVLASRRIGPAKGGLIVLGLTAFCVAVFSYGIGMPARLVIWPPERF